jgi:hypothetical protein
MIMKVRTCVTPEGRFVYGIHKPSYTVTNLRENDFLAPLGTFADGTEHDNHRNFPPSDVNVREADWVYEIPNVFSFRGTTYINKSWADRTAADPRSIKIPRNKDVSLTQVLKENLSDEGQSADRIFEHLPQPVLLALATTSSDPADLVQLAQMSCEFQLDPESGSPVGLRYFVDDNGVTKAAISNHDLFEAVVNNRYLPDEYKEVMVLRPGAQGDSEIVGECPAGPWKSHVFEYLRSNSYIPWGHYASNMANDAIRYRADHLTEADMTALRFLYYQRIYVRLAKELGVTLMSRWRHLESEELEKLRQKVLPLARQSELQFNGSLWGWNYGFDFAPSGYRLHASHQQIHQQFAMIPSATKVSSSDGKAFEPFSCGDMIAECVEVYREKYNSSLFDDYIQAIRTNKRIDDRETDASLIVFEDEHVILFVPKAQTSQWELQLMTTGNVGNILEADTAVRRSLDMALLRALSILTAMGAAMVTTIEYSKRFTSADSSQRLLYSFLPRLPWSPGAFSEAQLRFISGHYPEDFAAACRSALK